MFSLTIGLRDHLHGLYVCGWTRECEYEGERIGAGAECWGERELVCVGAGVGVGVPLPFSVHFCGLLVRGAAVDPLLGRLGERHGEHLGCTGCERVGGYGCDRLYSPTYDTVTGMPFGVP